VLTATGVALIAIPAIVASVVLIPGLSHLNWKWARFSVVTIFFVVYCLKSYWRARGDPRFWTILLGVLAIHFMGVGYFFWAGTGLPLMLFAPTVALEFVMLALTVHHFLGVGPAVSTRRQD
jgi:hypothetical protein